MLDISTGLLSTVSGDLIFFENGSFENAHMTESS